MTDELDEEIVEDDPADDEEDGSADSETGPESGDPKRIRDLMGMFHREQAKNTALEARLAALEAKGTSNGGAPPPEVPPEVSQWTDFLREQARDQVYASDPRLAKYGFEPSSIEGATPAAMRASMKRVSGQIDRIETDAKNAALRKHGLSPDSAAGVQRTKDVDYSQMSDEEFDRVVTAAKGRL